MENNNPNKKNNKKRYYRHHNKKKNKKDEINEISSEDTVELVPKAEETSIEETEENLEFLEDMIPEIFETPEPKKEANPDEEQVEVVGIRFKKVGKVYYFSPEKIQAKKGEYAIVDTARGPEFGEVFIPNKTVGISEIVPPLRPIIRIATPEDVIHNEENTQKEKEAFAVCLEQIAKHELDMKLVDAQYTFDNSKLLFYFTSAGRVDFRELVKDLAAVFRTRIELRQIGIRDEA